MATELIQPSEELKVLIRNFAVMKSDGLDFDVLMEFCSEEYVIMAFDFKYNKSFLLPGENFTKNLLALELENTAQFKNKNAYPEFFVVICVAGAFFRVFKVNEYSSGSINKIFDNYPMLKSLKDIVSVREKVHFFENFILNNTSVRKTSMQFNQNNSSCENESGSEITTQEVTRGKKINNLMFQRNYQLRDCLLI